MPGKKLHTDSGIEVKEIYTKDDLSGVPPGDGLPGDYPYTRGVQPDMYRGKLWTMRQYAGFSTAEESNERYHYLLSQGVMGHIAAHVRGSVRMCESCRVQVGCFTRPLDITARNASYLRRAT